LDFLYRFNSNDVGAYIHVGTGIRFTEAWAGDMGFGGIGWHIVYSAGLGYNFNRHIGIEARYSTQKSDYINSGFPYIDKSGNIEYMQLGISYRF
jgi:hypothetical protein